jgi:hypothetical protein
MPVKVLDSGGFGDFLGVAKGIAFAATHNVRVINLSLGGSADPNASYTKTLCGAVSDAVAAGVVVVAAAGNTYGGGVLYPAACADALAVTGTDKNNQIAYFSPRGSQIALAAPGVQIIGDGLLGGGRPSLVSEDGTSLSAPFVSGAAAILLGIPGNGTYNDVVRQLETTALDLGAPNFDPVFGFGLLQLDKALQLAVTEHPLPPTPTATEPEKKSDEGDGNVGPTDTPEFAGSGGFGGAGGAISSTPTPTATSTSTATATSTLTATATSTDTPAATPGAALTVKTTAPPAVIMPMPPMPWVAGFFLLAGMVLIGYALVLRRNA